MIRATNAGVGWEQALGASYRPDPLVELQQARATPQTTQPGLVNAALSSYWLVMAGGFICQNHISGGMVLARIMLFGEIGYWV